jgi:CheY-like chemotaxis protein
MSCRPGAHALSERPESLMESERDVNPRPAPFRTCYRILVVDDNRDAAESLQFLLRLLGAEVQVAHDGIAALEMAEQYRPHVVVLDIGLPKLDGYQAAKSIRECEWGKDMVLVAVSGWCREEDREHSQASGLNGHLAKPVRVEEIRNLIQQLLDDVAA